MHKTSALRSAGWQPFAVGETFHSLFRPLQKWLHAVGRQRRAATDARTLASRSPLGLYVAYAVEVCVGFALYILSTSLVLLLTERDRYSQSSALGFVGAFNCLCYLGPLLGGWLADRFLGYRGAVLLGASVLCAGFGVLMLAPPSLLLASGFLVAGSALFRPNMAALIGRICAQDSQQREHAYRRAYLAFNVGATIGPPAATALRMQLGWTGPFFACMAAMAAVSLFIGVTYPYLGTAAQPDDGSEHDGREDPESPVGGGSAPRWREISMVLVVTMLWAICVAQSDGTLLLWARDHTRRMMLGRELPASIFSTLPALLVLMLSPVLSLIGRLGLARSASSRLALGMWSTALSMALMAGAAWAAQDAKVSACWLLGCFVLLVVGEMVVAPLTQSMLMGLVPHRRSGLVLAMSYGSMAAGYGLAGAIGALWVWWPKPAFFMLLAGVTVVGGLLLKLGMPQPSGGAIHSSV